MGWREWGLTGVRVDAGANLHLGIVLAINAGHAVVSIISEADDDIGVILNFAIARAAAAGSISLNIRFMPTIVEKISIFVGLVKLSGGAFVEILRVVGATNISVSVGDINIGAVGFTDSTVDIDMGFFGDR